MTIYTVTAANKYFWQKLAAKCRNPYAAERKFRAFLKSRASRREEEYEYAEGGHLWPDRTHYVYTFNEADIEEADSTERLHHIGVVVEMIDSGGNG